MLSYYTLETYTTTMYGITSDSSSVTYYPTNNTIFIVESNPGTPSTIINIYEHDINIGLQRKITTTGFLDIEGICWVSGNTFAVIEEREYTGQPNNTPSTSAALYKFDINSDTTTIAASDCMMITVSAEYFSNKGFEGISYDNINNKFYAVREGMETGSLGAFTPGISSVAVFSITMDGVATQPFDAISALSGVFQDYPTKGDLGDVYYDSAAQELYTISDLASAIFKTDLSGNVLDTLYLTSYGVSGLVGQLEGITFNSDLSEMYITGEPTTYMRFVYNSPPVIPLTGNVLDDIVFTEVPLPSEVTHSTSTPFTVSITASDYDTHTIILYSQYSRSAPYQITQSKWSHLLPQWRFTDLNGNVIDKIETTDTTITDSSGNALYVTGYAQFHYIDDMPTLDYTSPVMLWATMDVSGRPVNYDDESVGYSNSMLVQGTQHYVNGINPTYLNITKDGTKDINKIKWVDTNFRYVITPTSDVLTNMCSNITSDTIVFDYPQDTTSSILNIERGFTNIPDSSVTFNSTSAYFERYDDDDYYMGGVYINSVNSSASSLNTQLSSTVSVESSGWYRDTPFAWISNTGSNTLNKVNYPYSAEYTNGILPSISPYLYATTNSTYYSAVSGETTFWRPASGWIDRSSGGIFGIAVDYCYNVWTVSNALSGYVSKFTSNGTLLSSIYLGQTIHYSPSVALDSKANAWVTRWTEGLGTFAIKYDKNMIGTTLILLASFPFVYSGSDYISARPVQIDTDTEDNAWVTYSHPLCSSLAKYTSAGALITSVFFPLSAQPQGMVVDPSDNSVWVCEEYQKQYFPYTEEQTASGGAIQKYDSMCHLVSSFENIPHPAYLTIDQNSNPWFTFGESAIGCISGYDVIKRNIANENIVGYGLEYSTADNATSALSANLEGIACDSRERIWVLNTTEARAYILSINNISAVDSFLIYPRSAIERGIQAFGDWTGYQMIHKYVDTPKTYSVSGTSALFDIYANADDINIRKFNESWDSTKQMRDYALSEHIYNNVNLFNTYLDTMVGNKTDTNTSLGGKSYEKIANFVNNNSNINTCEIDQLYSISEEVDVPIDNYKFNYPPSLKRLINIASISHNNLWGTRCKCNTNFVRNKAVCSVCGHDHCFNRGTDIIDQATYMVSGGVAFVVQPIFGQETYETVLDTTHALTGVALSSTSSVAWLLSSDYATYKFYKYIPTLCDVQVEGVINWDDDYTTLSETNSSLSAWYTNYGIIDRLLMDNLYGGINT